MCAATTLVSLLFYHVTPVCSRHPHSPVLVTTYKSAPACPHQELENFRPRPRAPALQVKCSRTFPCDRCFDACLQCLPPWELRKDRPYVELAASTQEPRLIAGAMLEALSTCLTRSTWDRGAVVAFMCVCGASGPL